MADEGTQEAVVDSSAGDSSPDFTDVAGWSEAAEASAPEASTEHPGWESLAEAVRGDQRTRVGGGDSDSAAKAKRAFAEAVADDDAGDSDEATSDDVAAIRALVEEDTPPQRNAKKPWDKYKNPGGRMRILEKERDAAKEELSEIKEMLKVLMPQPDAEPGEEEIDPDVNPTAAILREIREAKDEIVRLKQEREREREMAAAHHAVKSVDDRLNAEIAADPVFKGAFDHVTKVVINTHIDNPQFGATEQERRLNIFASLLSKELEWHKQGKDPVEEIYRQAMRFGFDPDDYASRAGVQYGPDGRPVAAQPPAPARQARPQAPIDKVRAARRKDTATVANVIGSPPKRFNARAWASKDEAAARYEIRKLVASGDLPAKPTLRDLIPPEDIFDDGL